jgi:hypothetical protein
MPKTCSNTYQGKYDMPQPMIIAQDHGQFNIEHFNVAWLLYFEDSMQKIQYSRIIYK